ncbi:hypothetical protein C5167_041794 [Papaver somniferum]|nr:hypothetical protein C5167_041794 [Papaver somniferum]
MRLWYLVKDFRPEDAAPVSPGCVPEQMDEAVLNDEIVIYPRTPGHYHGPVAAPTSDASSGLQTLVLVAFCLGGLGILGGVIFTTVICYRHFRDRARSRARDAARALDAARDILDHVQLQGLPSGRAPHTQEAIIVQQPGGGVSQS